MHQSVKPFALYDYQVEDRAKVADAFFDKGLTRLLGVWPTGSGKTVLFSELHLEERFENWLPYGKKILVIAHRDELIKQAVDKIQRSNPTLQIGVEKAAQRHSPYDDVVVASVQTLTAAKGARLRGMDPDEYGIVVIDEAHHAASPSYHVVLQHFGFLPPASFMQETRPVKADGKQALLNWQRLRLDAWDGYHKPERLLLGVTATAKRGDNIGLECVFQEIVFNRTIREMIERGKLCPIRAFRVETATSLDHIQTRAGDLAQDQLAQAVNEAHRNAKAVRAYLDYAEGRKGITFCVNIAHAVSMAAAYRMAGVRAAAIHGNLTDQERAEVLRQFSAGEITMLTNCQILTEGFDEPNVQVIVHARPTKSSLLYIQMTGRGLRIAPGKENCIVIDIVDVTKKHSLITSPELLGLPAGFDAKGGDLLDLKQRFEAIEKEHPLADLTDVRDIEECKLRVSEVDLLGSFHDDTLDHHAALAWQRTGEGYELDWRGVLLPEFVTVQKGEAGWTVTKREGKTVQWQKTATTPENALRLAEDYIRTKKPAVYHMNKKSAPWRSQPAEDNQMKVLATMGIRINRDKITKGDAANLISQYWSQQRKKKVGI